jgi:hypothetical protein
VESQRLSSIFTAVRAVGVVVTLLGCFAAGLLGNLLTMPEIPAWDTPQAFLDVA